ncbi:YkgJ family cysteine cluster protein [Kiritimatiella glycovorans]|uniref:Flagellin N-methylase n=1 Tax=Kiritimatiella glycovorans TaxID=1307763 RepID=A0A0G3ECB5_9BACT|nr:YkgJ family cysteine cluster protein [Kiritimatiella glycovorans]AKJ64151.1 hypothetical protein L21SP4_00888 [Kiritimatiella glycovorans]
MDHMDNMEHFRCRRCGQCCRRRGYVWLETHDVERLAEFLGIDTDTFLDRFTRIAGRARDLSLIENDDGSCVFLKNGRCEVYQARPLQCRTFPWAWGQDDPECPGLAELR